MKQWQLAETQESGTAVMEGTDVIFYTDDINPELVSRVVAMYNEGKTTEEISLYLTPGSEDCTQDQHDFIMEQINAYIKLTTVDTQTETQRLMAETSKLQGKEEGTLKELTRGEKAAATRKANAVTKLKTGSSNAQTAIKALEDKIQLIKLLDSAEVIEIPTGLDKAARDVLVDFQKAQQELIDSYLEKVKGL